MSIIIKSHGIEFIRTGSCNQCGACGCDKEPCPHHFEWDGKHWCEIYEHRDEYCEQCETDHLSCIGFPDNPWIRVVREGICGYKFERVDGGSMNDLPFLNGEPY